MKKLLLYLSICLALPIVGVLIWYGHCQKPAVAEAQALPPAQEDQPSLPVTNAKEIATPQAPRTASALRDTNLVVVAHARWGFKAMNLPAASVLRQQREQEMQLQDIIGKDIAAGINQEARVKEARLRTQATQLSAGRSPEEAAHILGPPDAVQMFSIEGHTIEMPRTNSMENVPVGQKALASYWPRVGVPFDGTNGQGYMVLYLMFDAQHRLERWQWEFPAYIEAGGLTRRLKLEDYWNGKHALSGPPPDGI